ncbi:MAG TPA: MEKHLA domain-containing protein [Planctomycetota bacterium]|nr:MEKHLA domain-containing protein [Planctomycetota bacterium]
MTQYPDPCRPDIVLHTQRLLNSFRRWTGRELLPRSGSPEDQSRALFQAPFVVVSDGTQPDPILNYGNAAALELWQMSFEQLTSIPSRQTAEPVHQAERARLMAEVTRNGFIADYKGIRIASTGRRFAIERAIVWIVTDEQQQIIGKAATFDAWTFLDEKKK